MDAPTAVTTAENRALAEIARELGVDRGESWCELMHELERGPRVMAPRSRSAAGPPSQ